MSKRYTGGVVSSAVPTVNAAGASGVFTLGQQASAQSNNNWPPYKIEESLRFRGAASPYLSRTPSVVGNRQTWTFSAWIKRGNVGAEGTIISGGGTTGRLAVFFNSSGQLISDIGGTGTYDQSTAVFRDPNAWYHFVWQFDTTQSSAANRSRMYMNGVQVSLTNTRTFSQNTNYEISNSTLQAIGVLSNSTTTYNLDGYMSEINFVDGQALTPSAFGATDKDGNWSPITYTGTYGQNGYYLNFSNNTSAATMGSDFSGNGNNWTLNGFNVSTANTSYDIMIDVPEDQASSNVRANYATLNFLDPKNGTQSNGNLTHAMGSNDYAAARSTIGMKGGKWYWEAKCETTLQSNYYMGIGVTADGDYSGYNYIGSTSGGYSYDGRALKLNNNSSSSYGASYTLNDIIGVALDLDNGTIEYYKNGASQGVAYTGINTTRTYYAAHWIYTTQISYNFGQQPFAYTPPTGFKSLNTFNLPEPTIKQPNKQFDATLYTGTVANQTITNAGNFQPDFVWAKVRNVSGTHVLTDSIRGGNNQLFTNLTSAQATATNKITGFTSTGFTLGADDGTGTGDVNFNTQTYVAWQWNAGGANTTNTCLVTSIVRANPSAGFSVVSYTGPGSGGGTIGHGLGVAPKFIIAKNRSATESWRVYHTSLGATKYINLNATAAATTDSAVWTGTEPTSTVFGVANDSAVSGSGNSIIAYCFAEIDGYSKFGSYTGNGSTNGPFVYTGFRPAFVITKKSNNTSNRYIWDNKRIISGNGDAGLLYAEVNNSESDYNAAGIDLLSNGFKIRNADSSDNGSGDTIIYAAFAEMPFKYARSR